MQTKTKAPILAAVALTLAGLVAPALAASQDEINATLSGDASIWRGLFALAVADEIRNNCPTMEARKLRALGELNNLRDYALKQGYESSVVREFVTSKEEKKKFKAEAAEWLKAKGAEPGKPDAYCKIGEEEIAKGTLAGSLLRSTK